MTKQELMHFDKEVIIEVLLKTLKENEELKDTIMWKDRRISNDSETGKKSLALYNEMCKKSLALQATIEKQKKIIEELENAVEF